VALVHRWCASPLKGYERWGVLPALEQGSTTPGAGARLAGFMKAFSLQRFTRYPGSQVSIRPLALPKCAWGCIDFTRLRRGLWLWPEQWTPPQYPLCPHAPIYGRING